MNANWKEHLESRLPLLSEDQRAVVTGLLVNGWGEEKPIRKAGAAASLRLGVAQRLAVWREVFPGLAEEVELVWQRLPQDFREHEDRFHWPVNEAEHAVTRMERLHWLLLLSSEAPQASLPILLKNYGSLSKEPLGHSSLGDVVLVVMRAGGQPAEGLERQLRDQLAANGGESMGAFLEWRTLQEWDFADRGYAWIDELAHAGIDETRRYALLPWRRMPSGPWARLLQVILENRLARYRSVEAWILSAMGCRWRWKTGPGLEFWYELFARTHQTGGQTALSLVSGDPVRVYSALCAVARADGMKALEMAEDRLRWGTAEERLAVVEFLGWCPWNIRNPVLVPLVSHSDARVAGAAVELLSSFPNFPGNIVPDLLDRLEDRLQSAWPVTPPTATPLPESMLDRAQVLELFAKAARGGHEERGMVWLKELNPRSRAQLVHGLGDDPEDRKKRRLLLTFLRDRSWEVAGPALGSFWRHVVPEEQTALEDLLDMKDTKRRLGCLDLMMRWPDALRLASLRNLLGARKERKRQGGVELLRRLETELKAEAYSALVRELRVEGLLPAETEGGAGTERPSGAMREGNPGLPPPRASIPDLSTAFGLVDPSSLRDYRHEYVDRGTVLMTGKTLAALRALDKLIHGQLDLPFEWTNWRNERVKQTIRAGGIPYAPSIGEYTESNSEITLLPIWKTWWENRPEELRDGDGFELVRLRMLLGITGDTRQAAEDLTRILLGGLEPPQPLSKPDDVRRAVDWLCCELFDESWWEFCMDACEAIYVRNPEASVRGALPSSGVFNGFYYPQEPTKARMLREWKAGNGVVGGGYCHQGNAVRAFNEGMANPAEFLWSLRTGNISYLETPAFRHDHPAVQPLIDEMRSAILRAELMRGEAAQDSSSRAVKIRGLADLCAVLKALGDRALCKPKVYDDQSRDVVLTRLLLNSSPREEETLADFRRLIGALAIPRERIVELGVITPVWAAWIGDWLECPGFEALVWWLQLHCRQEGSEASDGEVRERWKARAAPWSEVPGEDLLEGAADVGLFRKARAGVNEATWESACRAAHMIGRANGHTRARLFADALLGRVTEQLLTERIRTRRDPEAVRALGLVPLPDEPDKSQAAVLRRYQVLATFLHEAAKAKAQRRASEETAGRIGLRNLAETAGAPDPEQFRWMMELEAGVVNAADFTGMAIGGVTLKLEIQPSGKVSVAADKSGQRLKTLPAAVRRDPAAAALMARCGALKEVAARIRPALESLMIRQYPLPVSVWKKLAAHPLAGVLLSRLVLGGHEGPLGCPQADGSGLMDADGKTVPWPSPDAAPLHLCHTAEFLPPERWARWREAVFRLGWTQPVKQVFRELFVLKHEERDARAVERYSGLTAQASKAAAILGKTGWVNDGESGLRRHFHPAGFTAILNFTEAFDFPGQLHDLTIRSVAFVKLGGGFHWQPLREVPPVVLSEALRDVEQAWTAAHRPGSNPLAARSTLHMRAELIRCVAQACGLTGVSLTETHARVACSSGDYLISLQSAEATLNAAPVGLSPVPSTQEIFLPFADEDPVSASLVSMVLWISER